MGDQYLEDARHSTVNHKVLIYVSTLWFTGSGFLESGVEILDLFNHCNQRTDIFLENNMKVIGKICPLKCVRNVSPHSLETVS